MAKGMHQKTNRKVRGRTSITGANPVSPTRPNVQQVQRKEAARPVTAGAGKHRGDRRDMSAYYTGNEWHAARGNTPRKDVKTRKR